jgi:Protein of unknown function (DUF3352)
MGRSLPSRALRGRRGNEGGRALALVLSLAIAAGAVAGCGDGDGADPATLAPPDAPFYAEFVIRPDGGQADAIEAFAERVAGIDDPAGAIIAELDASLAEDDVDATYEGEIEPWLGDRGAVFVSSFEESMPPEAAVVVEVTDTEAAGEFIDLAVAANPEGGAEQRGYGGTDYQLASDGTAVGLIGDYLAAGPENAFKVAVDAADGESLAESEDYGRLTGELGDDLLAAAYLEPGVAIEAAIASEDLDPRSARLLDPLTSGPLSDPLAVGFSATPDTAAIDLVTSVEEEDTTTDSSLIEMLPAESWLAVGAPDVGDPLARTLDQLAHGGLPGAGSIRKAVRDATGLDLRDDSLAWLGDASGFVEGVSAPGFTAGLIAEIGDAEAPRKLLARVETLAERDSGLDSAGPPAGAEYGFSLGVPGFGGGAEAGVIDDRLVAVFGGTVAQALEPESQLGDDAGYQAAAESLGEEFPPGLYMHLPTFVEVAEHGASATDPGYQAALPYLDAFESLVAGSRVEDGVAVTRVTVSLAD